MAIGAAASALGLSRRLGVVRNEDGWIVHPKTADDSGLGLKQLCHLRKG